MMSTTVQLAPKVSVEAGYLLTSDDLKGDLIQPGHRLFGIVWVNQERMSGTPCFAGTRVPVQSLYDHLEGGDSLSVFLEDFPPVTEAQAVALLDYSKARVLDEPALA